MKEDFSFLFQYLKKENIAVDQEEFIFQVQSHPDYPSLLSISDTLNFFKIENLTTRIENKDLIHLPKKFIALIQNEGKNSELAFIESNTEFFSFTINTKKIQNTKEEFLERFQNIVLIVEKTDENENENEDKTKTHTNKKTIMLSLIVLSLALYFFLITKGFSALNFSILLLVFTGVYLSIEAMSQEFGIKTKFSKTVCNITASNNCGAVINSKKNKILKKINFTLSSIVFFASQVIALFFFIISNQINDFYSIITLKILFLLPITLFSIYQQFFIIKKWCVICLAIISLIYLELFCLLKFNTNYFSLSKVSVSLYLFSLTISFLLIFYIRKIIKENFELKNRVVENTRFKRNYELFKMALLKSEFIENNPVNSNSLNFGNPNANLEIILVSNPFCGHCKEAHNIIEEILKRHNDNVSILIHFNFNINKKDTTSLEVHHKLVQIFLEKGESIFLNAMKNWYEKKKLDEFELNEISLTQKERINEILESQFIWNKKNELTFTPAIIINGYHFPDEYERNDLLYFINELVEDEQI